MKAKYYPIADFLNETVGENPSYMWRIIITAQEMIQQGCQRSTSIRTDTNVKKFP